MCEKGRRKCSLVVKPVTSKVHAEVVEEPVAQEETSPKGKKKPGVLGSIARSFKRNREDRSPEPIPEPTSPFSTRIAPSFSRTSLNPSVRGSMGPPPTLSPSRSFDSFGSERNYEAERLHHLLQSSQEDLRLTREHYLERERRQQEAFEVERSIYQARIDELQRRKGEGSSRRG